MFKGSKKYIIAIIAITLTVFIALAHVKTASAARMIDHSQRIGRRISENVGQRVFHRKTMFHGKFFDIYVNEDQKFISVHGTVEDWKEFDQVKSHFDAIAPAEYTVHCAIDLDY
ncbi:MAG: hypothetical protein ACMUIP_12020 [bacterium]